MCNAGESKSIFVDAHNPFFFCNFRHLKKYILCILCTEFHIKKTMMIMMPIIKMELL